MSAEKTKFHVFVNCMCVELLNAIATFETVDVCKGLVIVAPAPVIIEETSF